jgi:hypothetical protein
VVGQAVAVVLLQLSGGLHAAPQLGPVHQRLLLPVRRQEGVATSNQRLPQLRLPRDVCFLRLLLIEDEHRLTRCVIIIADCTRALQFDAPSPRLYYFTTSKLPTRVTR